MQNSECGISEAGAQPFRTPHSVFRISKLGFVFLLAVLLLVGFFVLGQPFDINGVSFALVFLGDQPIATLVPAFAAFGFSA